MNEEHLECGQVDVLYHGQTEAVALPGFMLGRVHKPSSPVRERERKREREREREKEKERKRERERKKEKEKEKEREGESERD